MKYFKLLFLGLLFTFFAACGGNAGDAENEHGDDYDGSHIEAMHGNGSQYNSPYVCPMHCEGSGSEQPGTCPVCGMEYKEMKEHVKDGHKH